MVVVALDERRKRGMVVENNPAIDIEIHEIEPDSDDDDEYSVMSNDDSLLTGVDDVRSRGNCPRSFICPLTMDVMFDPVLDAEGNSFERRALLEWLKEKRTSPISRQPLSDRMLIPNIALRDAIHEFMGNGWVTHKQLEQQYQMLLEMESSSSLLTLISDPKPRILSPARAKIDLFLQTAVQLLGCSIDLRLNEDGRCAFRYDTVIIVIDVPENTGIFCLYTKDLLPNDLEPSVRDHVWEKALELNFLQVDTRGGCLSVRRHDNGIKELVFSYTDRIGEITADDFSNIFRSFIETAIGVRSTLTAKF